MKMRTMIAGAASAALVVLVLGLPALAQAACPRVLDAAISVQIVDPGPRVTSTKSLDQINAMAGSHGLSRDGSTVLGITSIKLDSEVKVKYQGQPMGRTICVSVNRVEVKFGLKDHHVNLPREFPQGSCHYNVVMRHEMAHVDVNRRTVRKYADVLKNDMRAGLRRSGAVATASMVEGQNIQTVVIQKVLDDIAVRFNAELEKLHAVIDQPGGKYAAAGQCPGW